ncbi:MAG TPA: hypothetical protein VKQ07_00660 [Jatrophihabitantaceae bacterium]|nr:hypothetical protein [Jatrophihabitantaceae bacterium]
MADRQDAALMIQLAQWGTSLGTQDATRAIFADDFDPDSADVRDSSVGIILNFGETIGTLTKNGLLDTALVLDWLWVVGLWDKVGPAALRAREKSGVSGLYENFEALAAQQR